MVATERRILIKVNYCVSDSCASGDAEDTSGENLRKQIENGALDGGKVEIHAVVVDDATKIKEKLLEWTDVLFLDLILTTGGTGCSPRDVTPEATEEILEKRLPGMVIAMITKSLQITKMAMLSRLTCGIRGKTLIVNFPGSKKASQECLEIIAPTISHAVDLIHDRKPEIRTVHHNLQTEDSRSVPAEKTALRDLEAEPHHLRSDMHVPHIIGQSRHMHQHDSGNHQHGDHSHHIGHHHRHHHSHHHHHHHHDHGSSGSSDADKICASSVDESRVARRVRKSPFPLISVEEALKIVLLETNVCGAETISYLDGLHRVLTEDVYAAEPLPPFRASIKDGYAVLASDGAGKRSVIGDSTAGSVPSLEVSSGWCMRISTGAPLPPGADAVVQVEDTVLAKESEDGKEELEIEILVQPSSGQDIREIGSDIEKGEKILAAGAKLGPSEVGLLATVGVTKIQVHGLPRVGVMSTGNELVEPEEPLQPGKIRDSNRVTLLSALREQNFQPVDLGIAKDTAKSLLQQITAALEKVDVIVTSGGVSMGEKDLIRDVLTVDLGAKLHFARVFMKPGKPTTFATVNYNGRKKLFFGLPGNPVSAIVTFNLYVVPCMRKMCADPNTMKTKVTARLSSDIELDPRPEYHRCTLAWNTADGLPVAESTGNQLSSRLLSMKAANGMLLLPPRSQECSVLRKGQVVECLIIGAI